MSTDGARGRDVNNRFKYALGACMDAVHRYGASCECDPSNGNKNTPDVTASHVLIQCKSMNGTGTFEQAVTEGLVVFQVTCDSRPGNDNSTVCIEEFFSTNGTYQYSNCSAVLDGQVCQGCQKVPDLCPKTQNGSQETVGFRTSCGNVQKNSQNQGLCYHNSDGIIALQPKPPQPVPAWPFVLVFGLLAALLIGFWVIRRRRRQHTLLSQNTVESAENSPNSNGDYFWGISNNTEGQDEKMEEEHDLSLEPGSRRVPGSPRETFYSDNTSRPTVV